MSPRGPSWRIVELSRTGEPLHAQSTTRARPRGGALADGVEYALRAVAAVVLPGHDPRRYWRHVTATLRRRRARACASRVEHNRGGPAL